MAQYSSFHWEDVCSIVCIGACAVVTVCAESDMSLSTYTSHVSVVV